MRAKLRKLYLYTDILNKLNNNYINIFITINFVSFKKLCDFYHCIIFYLFNNISLKTSKQLNSFI